MRVWVRGQLDRNPSCSIELAANGAWAMLNLIFRLFASVAICIGLTSFASAQEYAANLAFVTEVIREWAGTERIRDTANKEMEGGVNEKMSGCIRNGTRFKLELSTQIGMLQQIKLKPPFAELPGNLAQFYKRKIELFDKMSAGCEALLTGPKPGVDYDAITAQAPSSPPKWTTSITRSSKQVH
jgi:hypothetical protein